MQRTLRRNDVLLDEVVLRAHGIPDTGDSDAETELDYLTQAATAAATRLNGGNANDPALPASVAA